MKKSKCLFSFLCWTPWSSYTFFVIQSKLSFQKKKKNTRHYCICVQTAMEKSISRHLSFLRHSPQTLVTWSRLCACGLVRFDWQSASSLLAVTRCKCCTAHVTPLTEAKPLHTWARRRKQKAHSKKQVFMTFKLSRQTCHQWWSKTPIYCYVFIRS